MRAELSSTVGCKCSHNLHGSFKDDNKFSKEHVAKVGCQTSVMALTPM